METEVREALARDRVVDITTRGRRSGRSHRIEIWFWRVDGKLFLTGAPGAARHWARNLAAEPAFVLHVKESATADLEARARTVSDDDERRRVFPAILAQIDGDVPDAWVSRMPAPAREGVRANLAGIARDREGQLPQWIAESPLVEIQLDAQAR